MRGTGTAVFVFFALFLAGLSLAPQCLTGQTADSSQLQLSNSRSAGVEFIFRAQQLDALNEPVSLYRIVEHLYPESLTTEISMCRLDLIKDSDTAAAYAEIGSGKAILPSRSEDALDSLKSEILNSPMAKSVAQHVIKPTGAIDTLTLASGLPVVAYRYDVYLSGTVQYRLWLTDEIVGDSQYELLSCLEQESRNSSFVASEQFRRLIGLILLKGVEYPPDSGKIRDNLMLVRFDTRHDTTALISASTVFEFSLQDLSGDKF